MPDSIDRAARVLVVYYSATGRVHALAKAVAEGSDAAGADVRLRPVEELAPEMVISQNQAWGRHRSEVSSEPIASLTDLEWADGIAFGTPTRFGNVAAQLKMFIDQAGQLWEDGKLINKVVTAFTSSQTVHGGQESTILALNNSFYHWGCIVLPLGYTVSEVFRGGGNPYGASWTSGTRVGPPDAETLAVAHAQGRRLARVAQVIGVAQERGLLDPRAGGVTAKEHGGTDQMTETCTHTDRIELTELPPEIAGCEDCLASGGTWVHLRMCQTCGHIGCCDSSPNRHASKHAAARAHPIIRSAEPGEDWSWCYVDEVAFVVEPGPRVSAG